MIGLFDPREPVTAEKLAEMRDIWKHYLDPPRTSEADVQGGYILPDNIAQEMLRNIKERTNPRNKGWKLGPFGVRLVLRVDDFGHATWHPRLSTYLLLPFWQRLWLRYWCGAPVDPAI